MRSVISADPFKCRVWHLHDRFAEGIDEHTCRAEIESFAAHGQIVPVLGRRLCDDPDHEIELICGARRLFAARHLNMPLLVELRELSDREALVAMDLENRLREDISPYERGVSYRRWLNTGHFRSQEDIARTLSVSASQVSRLLQIARLPAVVVDAFRTPADIRENWGLELADALDDPARRTATIRSARSLAKSPRPRGRDVMRKLLSSSSRGRKPKAAAHDRVVCGSNGAPLFRIRFLSNSVALIFAAEKVSEHSMGRIEAELRTILRSFGERTAPRSKRSIDAGEITSTAQLDFGTG